MAIPVKCECGTRFTVPDEDIGSAVQCPSCSAFAEAFSDAEPAVSADRDEKSQTDNLFRQMRDLLVDCSTSLERISARAHDSGDAGGSTSLRRQYKVLTQKDKWFSQKFDPALLEEALNSYAEQGWRVVGVTTASFSVNRDEMIVILERIDG